MREIVVGDIFQKFYYDKIEQTCIVSTVKKRIIVCECGKRFRNKLRSNGFEHNIVNAIPLGISRIPETGWRLLV